MSAITQLSLFDTTPFETVEPIEPPDLWDALHCLNSIPYINRGGCGISALAIYRWCKKNGIEVSDRPFVVVCADEWELEHNNSACEAGDVNEIWIPHVTIEIDGELYDSEGLDGDMLTEYRPYRQDYQLNEEELLTIINQPNWNSTFNRRKYRDIIAYGLGIDLSDVSLRGY